jgi:galactitol-specific phosphotransferase system IIB component
MDPSTCSTDFDIYPPLYIIDEGFAYEEWRFQAFRMRLYSIISAEPIENSVSVVKTVADKRTLEKVMTDWGLIVSLTTRLFQMNEVNTTTNAIDLIYAATKILKILSSESPILENYENIDKYKDVLYKLMKIDLSYLLQLSLSVLLRFKFIVSEAFNLIKDFDPNLVNSFISTISAAITHMNTNKPAKRCPKGSDSFTIEDIPEFDQYFEGLLSAQVPYFHRNEDQTTLLALLEILASSTCFLQHNVFIETL